MKIAVLLFKSKDKKGIVSKISTFLYNLDCNVISSDQFSTDALNGLFFLRIEFCFDSKNIAKAEFEKLFNNIAGDLKASWHIYYKDEKMRMGILVSKPDHCLAELLYLWKADELQVELGLVVSNHKDVESLCAQFSVPFYHVPATAKDRKETEILELVSDKTDFLVLARYMQILSTNFLAQYKRDIINIHHSFLPSFKGAEPYKQAFNKGVKIIGATAHYVTADLDEGPIISQMVQPVSHRDSIQQLKQKGRYIERLTLARALALYIDHRVIPIDNKTIIFE